MNHGICAEYKHVRIRPLRNGDLEYLRRWRNDKEISRFLSPVREITAQMQQKWFEKECNDNTSVTFAIEEIDELNRIVGSVAVYDINGSEAEVGKIVVGDPKAKGKKIGYYGLLLAMHVGYEKLGIEKFMLEVHEDNISAKIIYSRAGFFVTGKKPFIKGGYELEMELPKQHFYEMHSFIKDVKINEKGE